MSRVLFNAIDEITKKYSPFFHRGVDIVKDKGKVGEVIAHSEGIVVLASNNDKYGNYVKIKHSNGMYTLYAHLSEINVKKNEYVKRGNIIGIMGTNAKTKDIHLHFEVRNKKDKRINPLKYLDKDLPNNKEKNKIYYQVYDNKKQKWLKKVIDDNDFAGNIGNPIGAIYLNLDYGNIKYRVHEVGKSWGSFVANLDDYSGVLGKNVDGIEITSEDVKLIYRLHLLDVGWTPWIYQNEIVPNIYDKVVDGLQIRLMEDD